MPQVNSTKTIVLVKMMHVKMKKIRKMKIVSKRKDPIIEIWNRRLGYVNSD